MKLSAIGPFVLGVGLLAAACGPAGSAPPAGGATAAPATQAPAAAAKPTTAPAAAAQPTTAPAAAPAQATTAPAAQASAAGKPVKGGQLVIATQRDATTFDPTKSQDVYSNDILSLVSDTLFEIDDKGQVVGRLVEKTENPQPNVYVFTLKKGIKFQDGTDLDSAAVKFNIERHINDPKATTTQDVKPITAIDTPDPQTVKITLNAPFAPFTSRLTTGVGFMLSPTAVQKLGDNLQRDLTGAGSGPYKFVSWQPDNQIVLERNPDFWGKDADGTQLPYLDKVIFKPFPDENVRLTNLKTGDADAMAGNPPSAQTDDVLKSPDLTSSEVPGLGFQFVFLNTTKPPFDNPAVRRALAYSIDRGQINQAVLFGHGVPLTLPIPPSVPWAYMKGTQYDTRDIAKAKQELASAGVSNVSFSLQISNASPQLQQLAELMKDQIKDAGFDMDIQLIEFATIVANGNTGDYQALNLGWSGSVDPDGNLYPLFYTAAGFNFAKYSNPMLDKALDDGRNNLDQAKRAQAYMDAQKILLQDQPMVVIYSQSQVATARKNVQGWPNTYNGWFGGRDIFKAWLSKS
ncbi:MAG TPA: ABC transporter substrate-binding protein [Chloroflexota bacterium]|jgi:peptide/nickel transport system substrate-binding protein